MQLILHTHNQSNTIPHCKKYVSCKKHAITQINVASIHDSCHNCTNTQCSNLHNMKLHLSLIFIFSFYTVLSLLTWTKFLDTSVDPEVARPNVTIIEMAMRTAEQGVRMTHSRRHTSTCDTVPGQTSDYLSRCISICAHHLASCNNIYHLFWPNSF